MNKIKRDREPLLVMFQFFNRFFRRPVKIGRHFQECHHILDMMNLRNLDLIFEFEAFNRL